MAGAQTKNGEARPRLSAALITFNEERNLPRVLESLRGVADEVVVSDSGSTDGTVEIARSFGARVFETEWPGYARQRRATSSPGRPCRTQRLRSRAWGF